MTPKGRSASSAISYLLISLRVLIVQVFSRQLVYKWVAAILLLMYSTGSILWSPSLHIWIALVKALNPDRINENLVRYILDDLDVFVKWLVKWSGNYSFKTLCFCIAHSKDCLQCGLFCQLYARILQKARDEPEWVKFLEFQGQELLSRFISSSARAKRENHSVDCWLYKRAGILSMNEDPFYWGGE